MIYRYDEEVSFDLPAEYKFLDTINDKGERSVQIGLNPHKEDGEEKYGSMFNISIANSDDGNLLMESEVGRAASLAIGAVILKQTKRFQWIL